MRDQNVVRLAALVSAALLPILPAPVAAQRTNDASASPSARSGAQIGARITEGANALLEKLHQRGQFPGGSAALILPDGEELAFTVGIASEARKLQPADRLLSGSIGKTYVAAAALHLVEAGKLSLDRRAAEYLAGDADWLARVPNLEQVTVRQLLRHQSGIPRYVFDRGFWKTLLEEPDKVWKPRELLSYVFDREPLFDAGEGWAYADTNFIVVGMIIEKLSGTRFYDYVQQHLLDPHGLKDTLPSDRRELPGLAQGYARMFAGLGIPEQVLEDGKFVINPQFEWCGGGFVNTPLDLARWARILYSGEAFDGDYLDEALDAVPAERLGPGTRYGIGVMLRRTDVGELLGHDGVFPGYHSTMGYLPEHRIAVAFQINTDDGRSLRMPIHEVTVRLARIAIDELARDRPSPQPARVRRPK